MDISLVSAITQIWNNLLVQIGVAHSILLLLLEHRAILRVVPLVLQVRRLLHDVLLKL